MRVQTDDRAHLLEPWIAAEYNGWSKIISTVKVGGRLPITFKLDPVSESEADRNRCLDGGIKKLSYPGVFVEIIMVTDDVNGTAPPIPMWRKPDGKSTDLRFAERDDLAAGHPHDYAIGIPIQLRQRLPKMFSGKNRMEWRQGELTPSAEIAWECVKHLHRLVQRMYMHEADEVFTVLDHRPFNPHRDRGNQDDQI